MQASARRWPDASLDTIACLRETGGVRVAFDDFDLVTDRVELLHHGQPVAMEPRVFDVLVHGRRALGDDGGSQRYLKTAHGRGYRFVAPVTVVDQQSADGSTRPASAELHNLPANRTPLDRRRRRHREPCVRRRRAHCPAPIRRRRPIPQHHDRRRVVVRVRHRHLSATTPFWSPDLRATRTANRPTECAIYPGAPSVPQTPLGRRSATPTVRAAYYAARWAARWSYTVPTCSWSVPQHPPITRRSSRLASWA